MIFGRINLRIEFLHKNSILIIQSLDWAYNLPDDAIPHRSIKENQLVALMSNGGNYPHLASSSKLLTYIKHHLGKWGAKPVNDDELDIEEEEQPSD